MLSEASPSSAVTLTVEQSGPSGNVHSKLLAAGVGLLVPLGPHASVMMVLGPGRGR